MYCGEKLIREELLYRVSGDRVYNNNELYNYFTLKAMECLSGFSEKFVYGYKIVERTENRKVFWTKTEKKMLQDDTKATETFIQRLPVGVEGSFSYIYKPSERLIKSSNVYYDTEEIVVDICVSSEWCKNVYIKAQMFAEKLQDKQTGLLSEFVERLKLSTLLTIEKDAISSDISGIVFYNDYNMQNLEDTIYIYGLALALCKKITDAGCRAKVVTDYQNIYIEKQSDEKLKEW